MIKLQEILQSKILVPRRSKEERQSKYIIGVQKQIKQYIENGSKGDLKLRDLTKPVPVLVDLKKVGGYLDFSGLTSIPEGFNLRVEGSLSLSRITSIPEGFNPTVGVNLVLSSVISIPEGFNPTVGGKLYLESVTSIPKRFNPAVGDILYLNNSVKIEKGWNPTNVHRVFLGKEEYKI